MLIKTAKQEKCDQKNSEREIERFPVVPKKLSRQFHPFFGNHV